MSIRDGVELPEYYFKDGDGVEIRLKSTAQPADSRGIQIFFKTPANNLNTATGYYYYDEPRSFIDKTVAHVTGRYETILLEPGRINNTDHSLTGLKLICLRVDPLHVLKENRVTGTYDIDYIYVG